VVVNKRNCYNLSQH